MLIRNDILQSGAFERSQEVFASGKTANNKLCLDRIDESSKLFQQIVCGMADLIVAQHVDLDEIDFLAPIPSGGDRFAVAISDVLAPKHKIPVVYFSKLPSDNVGEKRFRTRGYDDRAILRSGTKGVIIDDVSNELTSLMGMLHVPELLGVELDFCSVWHRGDPELLADGPIDVQSLVVEHIPNQLPADSPYWQFAANVEAVR